MKTFTYFILAVTMALGVQAYEAKCLRRGCKYANIRR